MTPRVLCVLAAFALLASAALLPLASAQASGADCSSDGVCADPAEKCATLDGSAYTCMLAADAGAETKACLYTNLNCDDTTTHTCDIREVGAYKCMPRCTDDTGCTNQDYNKCVVTTDGNKFCSAAAQAGVQGGSCYADSTCNSPLLCDTGFMECKQCNEVECPGQTDVCTHRPSSASSYQCVASADAGNAGQACLYNSGTPSCNGNLRCDTTTTYTCVEPTCDQDATVCTGNGQVCSTVDGSSFECRMPESVGVVGGACKADLTCNGDLQCLEPMPGSLRCTLPCVSSSSECTGEFAGRVCGYDGSVKGCQTQGDVGAEGQGCIVENNVLSCDQGYACDDATKTCVEAPPTPEPSSSTAAGEPEVSSSGADEGASSGSDEGASSGSDEGASSGSDEGASSGSDEGASSGTDGESTGSSEPEGPTGGDTGSATGGETGSETGSPTGGETGSPTGGETGSATGGETGSATGGETSTGSATGGQAECPDDCLPGQSCVGGKCIGVPTVQCATPCNITLGFMCDTRIGQCVAASGATCINCEGGLCIVSPFPGVLPTCLLPVTGAPDNCSSNAECPPSSSCRSSLCLPCTGACAELRGESSAGNGTQLIDLLFQSGFNPNTVEVVAASSVLSNGAISVPAGALVMIPPTVAGLDTLNLASASPAAALLTGSRSINTLQSSTAGNTVLLNGALQAASLVIASGGSLTISMPSGGAPQLNLSSLSLSGPLNLAGSTGAIIAFPTAASGVNLATGGSLSISGVGAGVVGNVGAAPLTLAATNGVPASIVSPAGSSFASSGSILGAGASFVVGGVARLAGQTLEPNFRVPTGGQLSIDTATAAAGRPQTVGDVDLSTAAAQSLAGRSLLAANQAVLEISGTAGSGANLQLGKLASCPSSAKLRYSVAGFAQAAIDAGITVFNYAASSNAASAPFTCAIEVCGSDGSCVAVDNPKVAAGRRLLATAGGVAKWEATKLTISSKTADPGNSAAAMAAQPIMLLALAFAAIVAMLRM